MTNWVPIVSFPVFLSLSGCLNSMGGFSTTPSPILCQRTLSSISEGPLALPVKVGSSESEVTNNKLYFPAGADPDSDQFPIVIYGKGQGLLNLANCQPNSDPNYEDTFAQAVADQGYIVMALGYRTSGSSAPGVGELRYRDHYDLDANHFVQAAEFIYKNIKMAKKDAVFIGHSMGTWAALHVLDEKARLYGSEECVNMKGSVLVGESANHLANYNQFSKAWDLGDLDSKATAIFGAAYAAATSMAAADGQKNFAFADFNPSTGKQIYKDHMEAPALELLQTLVFQEADTSLSSCSTLSGKPPVCKQSCYEDSYNAWLLGKGYTASIFDFTSTWLKPSTWAAYTYWEDHAGETPTETELNSNPFLKILYNQSPAYTFSQAKNDVEVVQVISSNDDHYDVNALNVLQSHLTPSRRILHFEQVKPSSDGNGNCEHSDYMDTARPTCGFNQILSALRDILNE